jgi:hypothetical protein
VHTIGLCVQAVSQLKSEMLFSGLTSCDEDRIIVEK